MVKGARPQGGSGSAVAHFGQLFLEGLTFLWGVLALPTGVFRLTAESAYYSKRSLIQDILVFDKSLWELT